MYLALYRKYRPRTFDDVISQPQIVTTLKNQIAEGQNAHAYLFTGSRGTGKTTCAKILAMALNCKHPVGGNPCLECESCREIANNETTDIVELDAASNSGVNDIHDLQDQLAYTPVSCKYRVYILDEVHMLSVAAFNALLKTIEEPPAHVIFILATTELHKVPATILSRCQRFEFRRIEIADSSARLLSIAQQEGVTLTQEAADMISRLSDGGMRDALSLLDRCIAVSRDVTEETVRSCAGVADNHHLYQFTEMTAARDIPGCIRLLEQLHKGGKDIARVMEELGGVFRDLMIFKSAPAQTGLLSAMPHDYPEIERLSGLFSLDEILRCLTLIQECSDGLAKTRSRRTLAEMCFVKLCTGAPTAAQAAAAAPVPALSAQPAPAKPAEYKPMGSEFAPLPDSQLKPSQAAAVNKIREIFNHTESKPESKPKAAEQAPAPEAAPVSKTSAEPPKPVEAAKPAETVKPAEAPKPAADTTKPAPAPVEAAPFDAPLPEMNSAPAAPDMDFAPLPEEPPEEFIPQREFSTAAESAPAPTVSAVSKPVEPAKQAKPAGNEPSAKPEGPEKPAKTVEPTKHTQPEPPEDQIKLPEPAGESYEKLTSVTPEEWAEIIKKVPTPLYESMLEDSEASVNDAGVLEIYSGNLMLQGMTANNSKALESELHSAFGKKVRALVIAKKPETAAEDKTSPVKELLDKARRLNIEVNIK